MSNLVLLKTDRDYAKNSKQNFPLIYNVFAYLDTYTKERLSKNHYSQCLFLKSKPANENAVNNRKHVTLVLKDKSNSSHNPFYSTYCNPS